MIKVIGHKAPDTDSTVSAIIYSFFLNNVKNKQSAPFIAGEPNKEAKFVLDFLKVETPEILTKLNPEDDFAIVDTNNPEELIEGYNEANLISIVDHHKLVGGLKTDKPISVTIRPFGCTATILFKLFEKFNFTDLPKDIAGLILAGILSDTLKFTSPTTTDEDKKVAQKMSEITNIDIDDFAQKMFDAKSDLSGMSAKDILLSDSKVFEMGGKIIRISVLETTKPENALSMKSEITTTARELKQEQNLDGLFFFVVDILNTLSHLIIIDEFEKQIAQKAFGNFEGSNDTVELKDVVSRKKQMVPNIEKAIVE